MFSNHMIYSKTSAKNIARILFIIPGFLLLFTRCGHPEKQHKISPAFYYWKTHFKTGKYEQQVLDSLGAKTLYIRLFDVDWPQQEDAPLPLGIQQAEALKNNGMQYIPVVYITQRCLLRLNRKDLPGLTAKIAGLTQQLCLKYNIHCEEIQLDCDWTQNSSKLYFELLREFKKQSFIKTKSLSCTIRMHQVKYTMSNGVPPVDRGLLMVYNMGNLTRYGSHNSILDPGEAKDYLKYIARYPLPLDIALPLYYWSALFDQKRFQHIVYNIGREHLDSKKLEKTGDHLYRFKTDVTAAGYRFTQGQEIRFESPTLADLTHIAAYLSSQMVEKNFKVAFFHLDSMAMDHFKIGDMQQILDEF